MTTLPVSSRLRRKGRAQLSEFIRPDVIFVAWFTDVGIDCARLRTLNERPSVVALAPLLALDVGAKKEERWGRWVRLEVERLTVASWLERRGLSNFLASDFVMSRLESPNRLRRFVGCCWLLISMEDLVRLGRSPEPWVSREKTESLFGAILTCDMDLQSSLMGLDDLERDRARNAPSLSALSERNCLANRVRQLSSVFKSQGSCSS